MRTRAMIVWIAMALPAAACGTGDHGATRGAVDSPAVARTGSDSAAAGAAHAHAAAGEGEALLPIMQRLGARMTSLTYGLMTDDRPMIVSSAAAIAEHAPIAPHDLERIRGTLGSDMAEFERLDAAVHAASVRLSQTAEAGSAQDVLARLSEVQRGCVACHALFRERLRTNPAPRK